MWTCLTISNCLILLLTILAESHSLNCFASKFTAIKSWILFSIPSPAINKIIWNNCRYLTYRKNYFIDVICVILLRYFLNLLSNVKYNSSFVHYLYFLSNRSSAVTLSSLSILRSTNTSRLSIGQSLIATAHRVAKINYF